MIKIGKNIDRNIITGTPSEIISEIGIAVDSFYSSVPTKFKPSVKKMILECMNKVLCDDSGNNGKENDKQEEPLEEKKPIFDDDSIAVAAAETLAKMMKKDPTYLIIADDLLEFYTEAVKELLGRDKEEKKS